MAENTKTTAKARKPAAKRKPATKRKPVAKRKAAVKRAAPKQSTANFAATAQETGSNVFLAGLGFYGKAFDQAQEQLDGLQKELQGQRKKADKAYQALVTRGKKVEKDAKDAIEDLELENLADRKKIEQQLRKAKTRFADLKKSVRLKIAA